MNAATRQDVVLMSTATPLGFATSTKTVNLQLENTKIIFFAQKVRKNCIISFQDITTKFCLELHCPAGYDYKEGDIPGWGQLKGRIETTMEGCSDECSNQAGCCSYEYSYSSGLCNLNKDCEPAVGKYKDYLFCTKGEKKL